MSVLCTVLMRVIPIFWNQVTFRWDLTIEELEIQFEMDLAEMQIPANLSTFYTYIDRFEKNSSCLERSTATMTP